MRDEGMDLSEILDGVDVEDPDFDEVATESDEDNEDEAPEAPESQPDSKESMIAEFERTGNPNALPAGPLRDRVLGLMQNHTRATMEAAALRRQMQQPQKEPDLDLNSDPDDIVKQIKNVSAYEASRATEQLRAQQEQIAAYIHHQQQEQRVNSLESYVASMPGYTDEIGDEMGRIIIENSSNPQFAAIAGTEAGLKMLFDSVSAKHNMVAGQNSSAHRAVSKRSAPIRGKTGKARPATSAEKYGDLGLSDSLDKIMADAVKEIG